jgi:eukaryotic-like serine/threonine-protein kinase
MMEHFKRAADAYRSASEIAASDPKVYLGECELWAQTMNASRDDVLKASFEKARIACEKAIQASPRSDAGRLKLAFVKACFAWWIAMGVRIDSAEKVLQDAIAQAEDVNRRRPEDPMALYVAGAAWRSEAWYMMQLGLANRPSLDRAITAYESAVRLDPTFLWALSDLCGTYMARGLSDTFRGMNPSVSMDKAIEHCDRASRIQPNALRAHGDKAIVHLTTAEYLVDVGRDPAPSLELTLKSIEAGRKLSADWQWADYLLSYAGSLRASHALALGHDPGTSLEAAAASAGALAKRDPDSADTHEMLGRVSVIRALDHLRRGDDPEPSLREARAAFQRAMDTAPWILGYHILRARPEIVELRFAIGKRKAREEGFQAAFLPLLPLLDRERIDPRLYQAMAEIHSLRAAWLLDSRKAPEADIEKGLEMASRALALNPHMATALAARGALLLTRARASRDAAVRAEAAAGAEEAIAAAVKENPTLEREQARPLADARAWRRVRVAPTNR